MSLCQPIPLYAMRSQMSFCLQDIVKSSQNAHKVMMVRTIPADPVSRVEDDPTYVELGITFHPDDHENQPLKMDVNVIMPKGWTPKMYLASLNKSMKRHLILPLESITIDGTNLRYSQRVAVVILCNGRGYTQPIDCFGFLDTCF
jgi:hypothetical protein